METTSKSKMFCDWSNETDPKKSYLLDRNIVNVHFETKFYSINLLVNVRG